MRSVVQAKVLLNGVFTGLLEKTQSGFVFTYDVDYISKKNPPISYSLPLRSTPYKSEKLHGFFSGLVAEGWLKRLQCSIQKVDEMDEFRLLLNNGADLTGAVTIEKI